MVDRGRGGAIYRLAEEASNGFMHGLSVLTMHSVCIYELDVNYGVCMLFKFAWRMYGVCIHVICIFMVNGVCIGCCMHSWGVYASACMFN